MWVSASVCVACPAIISTFAVRAQGQLEFLLSSLDRFDEELVQKKEKEMEKERRELVREERINTQKEAYAQRLQVRHALLPHL